LKQFAADHPAEDFMAPEEHSRIEAALRESRLAEMKAKQAAIDAAMQAAREAAAAINTSTDAAPGAFCAIHTMCFWAKFTF
jgi:hypothetical protein